MNNLSKYMGHIFITSVTLLLEILKINRDGRILIDFCPFIVNRKSN